jgi:exonuclease-1
MALQLIKACRAKNVDCIVAPYEADAQLAYLNLQGKYFSFHTPF